MLEQDRVSFQVVTDIFERAIPENILASASRNNEMLALIVVCILIAFAALRLKAEHRDTINQLFEAINELMLLITNWIMKIAPIGVFGLITSVIAKTGGDIFSVMLKFFFVVILALLIHLTVTLSAMLIALGKISPLRHIVAMREALLTAFSTASSSATLPITMRCAIENAKLSERATSFVLPLGATVNMDGTALYECVAVIFISQVLGYDLSAIQQIFIVILALLTSIGVAGVPQASLVAIVLIVNNVGIEGAAPVIAAILAVDRLLDMTRTAVNVYSDSCIAAIVDKKVSV